MKATVYHVVNYHEFLQKGGTFNAEVADGMELEAVAEVEINPFENDPEAILNQVYKDTNHIDCPWWENDGVKALRGDARSTSIGDVIEVEGFSPYPSFHRVAPFGFDRLPIRGREQLNIR